MLCFCKRNWDVYSNIASPYIAIPGFHKCFSNSKVYYVTLSGLQKESSSSYDQTKGFRLGSKCCACLICTAFPCYILMYTGVHLVASLEWGIHMTYMYACWWITLIWGVKMLHTIIIITLCKTDCLINNTMRN